MRVQSCHARPEGKDICVIQTATNAVRKKLSSCIYKASCMYFATSQPSGWDRGNKRCSRMAKDSLSLKGLLNTAREITLTLIQVPNAPSTILIVCQDPVSSSLLSCFELAPTICIQMCYLQLMFQQLSKTVKALRRGTARSFQHCYTIQLRVCCSLFCHGSTASPEHIIKSPPSRLGVR